MTNTRIDKIVEHPGRENNIELFIKRDDLIDPVVSGNKLYKLMLHLESAKNKGCAAVVTVGGIHSNHIAATAKACRDNRLKSIGYIRGDATSATPTLTFAKENGMEIRFVDRETYRQWRNTGWEPSFMQITNKYHFIPEGGRSKLGVLGARNILPEDFACDVVCTPIGSGTSAAGLLIASGTPSIVEGYLSLKNPNAEKEISDLIDECGLPAIRHFACLDGYHFGGFAKHNSELVRFITDFKTKNDIQLDPIYTGKMMFGIFDRLAAGSYASDTRILAIHTGGLQGIAAYEKRYSLNLS